MRGKPIESHQLLVRGYCLSGFAAFILVNGLLDVQVVQGTTNGETLLVCQRASVTSFTTI